LGRAGSTSIDEAEDKRLQEFWEKSDLWPQTSEYETSISGPGGEPKNFSNFCPEIIFDRFGYFASFIARHGDEIDRNVTHKQLEEINAPPNDWRWLWGGITPCHYTDCYLYSTLDHRSKTNRFPFLVDKGNRVDPLPPKPPEFLQKVKWLWQYKNKYRSLIIVSAVLGILLIIIQNLFSSFISKNLQNEKTNSLVTPSEKVNYKKNQFPALKVTFIDGHTAIVEMSAQIRVDSDKLLLTHSKYGDQNSAIVDLLSSIRGNAIAILEKYSLPNARTHRKKIAQEIIISSKEDMNRTGHIIESISLAEFTLKE
jgi:hypothetical protein